MGGQLSGWDQRRIVELDDRRNFSIGLRILDRPADGLDRPGFPGDPAAIQNQSHLADRGRGNNRSPFLGTSMIFMPRPINLVIKSPSRRIFSAGCPFHFIIKP